MYSIDLLIFYRYEHLARSAPAILDDSLSADSYLNILYMPSTFPRSERSRRSHEPSSNDSAANDADFEDGPRSNLDSVRYLECVNYFQEVSSKLPHHKLELPFHITFYFFHFSFYSLILCCLPSFLA